MGCQGLPRGDWRECGSPYLAIMEVSAVLASFHSDCHRTFTRAEAADKDWLINEV